MTRTSSRAQDRSSRIPTLNSSWCEPSATGSNAELERCVAIDARERHAHLDGYYGVTHPESMMTIAQAQEHMSPNCAVTPSKSRARLRVTPDKRALAPRSGRVIRTPEDLSEQETNLLVRDMIAAMDDRGNSRPVYQQDEVTDDRRDEGFRFLFENGWISLQPQADKPHQFDMKKRHADSSICFGNFEMTILRQRPGFKSPSAGTSTTRALRHQASGAKRTAPATATPTNVAIEAKSASTARMTFTRWTAIGHGG